jgi:metallo-beta-lactamase family protein
MTLATVAIEMRSLQFYGAAGTVTGSKYLVTWNDRRLLVDCGLFQGFKQLRLRNWAPLEIDLAHLDAIVLSHAHIDHSGALPLLVRNGWRGPVYCTPGTRDLCEILLRDAARLQEEEASWANERGYSKHHPALPLYTEQDAADALQLLRPCSFASEHDLGGTRLRMVPAGHILGAAIVELFDDNRRLVFSGDLGRPHDLIAIPPARVRTADMLVVESTYGDRTHTTVDPATALRAVVDRTLDRGGVTVIPAFAVGRTQAVLHLLAQMRLHVPIFLDSPMAIAATRVYLDHEGEHRLDAEDCRALASAAEIVESAEVSRRLTQRRGPMIIIAGSGMATGGRVLHHLRAFAGDARNTILFVGFQAPGTRGADLVAGRRSIRVHGEWIRVLAEIAHVDNLSAHADADEILGWLRGFTRPPRQTFITHGEPAASEALRHRIERELGWECRVPEYRESVSIDAGREA